MTDQLNARTATLYGAYVIGAAFVAGAATGGNLVAFVFALLAGLCGAICALTAVGWDAP